MEDFAKREFDEPQFFALKRYRHKASTVPPPSLIWTVLRWKDERIHHSNLEI
jgi:hypothetical protein